MLLGQLTLVFPQELLYTFHRDMSLKDDDDLKISQTALTDPCLTYKGWDDIQGHPKHREQVDGREGDRDRQFALGDDDVAVCCSAQCTGRLRIVATHQKNDISVTKRGASAQSIEKYTPLMSAVDQQLHGHV